MEYLIHIVLAVFVLAVAEEGVATDFEAPWAVGLLAIAPFAIGAVSRTLYLRGRFRLATWLWRALHWSATGLFALAVCVFGWSTTVERWTGASTSLLGWPSLGLLVAFVPFVVYALVSIDVRVRHTEIEPNARATARRFHMRMFASGLAPTVCFAVGAWIVGQNATWRVDVEHVGLFGMGFVLASVALFTCALPWILRASWDTQPLEPSPLRTLLEDVAVRAQFRYRELLFWRTGDLMANAAVIGVGRFDRVVLFSDVLIASLSPREIVAVLAHEIGHAKRGHVLIFVAWTGALFLAGDLAGREVESEWLAGVFVLALFAVWYKLFGWLSRRFELEADLYALRLTRDPLAIVGALERVGGAHSRQLDSWRHFSTAKRIDFVERVTADERVALQLERKLRALTWTGIALFVIALGFSARRLVVDFPRDRVVAALALADWDLAEQRFATLAEPSEDLARGMELVATLGPDDRARPEVLVLRAQTALANGDAETALQWLSLADLAGAYGNDELETLIVDRDEGALEPRFAERTPAWQAAARAYDATRSPERK
ncbi:MAG: M48 family metalloprotease [Planctomycetes bacterium]|nr:M48 family metalloprotease [Planctomycetota bacterium]